MKIFTGARRMDEEGCLRRTCGLVLAEGREGVRACRAVRACGRRRTDGSIHIVIPTPKEIHHPRLVHRKQPLDRPHRLVVHSTWFAARGQAARMGGVGLGGALGGAWACDVNHLLEGGAAGRRGA